MIKTASGVTTTKISIYDTSFTTLYKQCHYLNIIECTMSLNLKRHNLVYFLKFYVAY